MVSKTQPDAGTTRYKYDSRHNVRFSQDAQQAAGGKVSYFSYDPFSRMIRSGEVARAFASLDANRAYAFETGAASWTSRYIYDIDDVYDIDDIDDAGESGAAAFWPVGRPVRIEQNTDADAAAEVTARVAYDREGRVTRRRVAIEGLPDKDVFYSYDLAGKVTAMVYPDGGEVHYAYDAAGRLAGVTDAEGNALATYAYDGDGRMTTHKVGHAVGGALATGAYAYNVRDWVSRIDYPGRFTLSQAYDAVGNVTSQRYRRAATEALKTAIYAYDGLHRLKSFNLGTTHARTYAYDANGNVTHVATGGDTATYAYSRGSTPNQLDSLTIAGSTDTFVYNANGAATQVAGNAMAYDHRGLLTGYGAHAYTLDAEGYRVKKTGGGSTVYYIRGAGGSVLATYDAAGNLTAAYVYAAGERLARVAGGVVSYYLKDHLGSTRTLLSSDGTAEATYDYWPYGEVLASSGTDSAPFKFTGHERDEESGLDFMPFRSYRPGSLRFLQVDPRAEKYPELSPYTYTAGNPLKYWDPDGRRIRLRGGSADRRQLFSLILKNLTPPEQQNIGIKYDEARNEYRVWTKAGYEGTSKAFGYLREVVNHPAYVDIRLNEYVDTSEGEINVQDTYGGGVTLPGKNGASTVTISPEGNKNRTANPDHIIFTHEVFGHARLYQQKGEHSEQEAIDAEDVVRKEQNLNPRAIPELPPVDVIGRRYVPEER